MPTISECVPLDSSFSRSRTISSAIGTGSSRSTTWAPIAPSTLRSSACAHTAPNMPVEAPITATGLRLSGVSASGRDTQSIAFFSWPGIEWLYSGVANRTASAAAIRSFRCVTAGCSPSLCTSSSYGGMSSSPSYSSNSTPDGSSEAAARRSSVLWESRRRLPDMPRTLMELGLLTSQLELDDQRHVVGQSEAALGERGVPLEAELRAVDHGLEGDADLGVAGDVLVRADERAAAGDRMRVALDRQLAVDHKLVALDAQVGRLVAKLGVVLDVEEVRRLEVSGQVLVLDDDRVGVHGADQLGLAVLAHFERGVEVLEAAA